MTKYCTCRTFQAAKSIIARHQPYGRKDIDEVYASIEGQFGGVMDCAKMIKVKDLVIWNVGHDRLVGG